MGETRARRSATVTKLGRMFGKSSTNLLDQDLSPVLLVLSASRLALQHKSGDSSPLLPSVRAGLPPPSAPVSRVASVRIDKEPVLKRYVVLGNGQHEHHLRAAKRQEKLGHMLKDWMGAKKLRDSAKLAVPELLNSADAPPTLFAGLVLQMGDGPVGPILGATGTPQGVPPASVCGMLESSFVTKYGRCLEVVGRGAFGVVRIAHKKQGSVEVLYAVKEFKRRSLELDKTYATRLTSEFCILLLLKHPNITQSLDLFKDAKGDYVLVMEFCPGGDLYTLVIAAGRLEYAEADCYFKQLMRGVNYMHAMGVAHRDLKPENLLLTSSGQLKITDFGNAECFRMAWEKHVQYSSGICGSLPYIAPEEYGDEPYDPRAVDVWLCGVIYMAMRTGRQLWEKANSSDAFFKLYVAQRKDEGGYEPIEALKRARCRNVIYSILDPNPSRRIKGEQVLRSEWGREIRVCEAGSHGVGEPAGKPAA